MPVAAAIAGGLVSALFFLSVLTGSTGSLILVYLVQLPLFGVGLSLGTKAALIAGGTATVVTTAAGVPQGGLIFGCCEAVSVVALTAHAMRSTVVDGVRVWSSAGALTVTLIGLGSAALLLAALSLIGEPGGLQATVHRLLVGELQPWLVEAGLPDADSASRAGELADLVSPLFPAMACGSWIVMTTINGILAQGALARFELNRRPSPDIASLHLPHWLALPVVGAVLLTVVSAGDVGYVATNLVPIIGIAYVLAGLAFLHAILRRYAGRLFILVPTYISLFLGWPVLLLALCGIIDQWFGLRSRIAATAPR